MTDQIVFFQRKDHVREKSQHAITATFRDRATAADVTPTNVRYRLDNLTADSAITDWTAASTSTSVTFTLTPTQNTLSDQCRREEQFQLTVAADYGLSTQFIESITYTVENLVGVS